MDAHRPDSGVRRITNLSIHRQSIALCSIALSTLAVNSSARAQTSHHDVPPGVTDTRMLRIRWYNARLRRRIQR